MVFFEQGHVTGIGKKERSEGLGKNIVLSDGIPGCIGYLILVTSCRRNTAEIAIGDVTDLIVVIKHHAFVSSDTKVFLEHVPRKDIGTNEVANGLTEIAYCASSFGTGNLREVLVQRFHPAFNIDVFYDQ